MRQPSFVMHLLIGLPIVAGGTFLRHYNFRAFELVMFTCSLAMTGFCFWLMYRLWPTPAERLASKGSDAYAGVILGSLMLLVSFYGNYIVLPIVTG